jgi:hypothetical protein
MRIVVGIALVTVLTAAVWSIDPTTAKQHNTVSIDPIGIMTIATSLPTEHTTSSSLGADRLNFHTQ